MLSANNAYWVDTGGIILIDFFFQKTMGVDYCPTLSRKSLIRLKVETKYLINSYFDLLDHKAIF